MLIKDLRTAKGMPQREFAAALGVDRTTIAKWETGAALPRAEICTSGTCSTPVRGNPQRAQRVTSGSAACAL